MTGFPQINKDEGILLIWFFCTLITGTLETFIINPCSLADNGCQSRGC